MSGEEVKEFLRKNKVSMKEIAQLLDLTPQNFSSMLQKDDVRSGLLEKIAAAIGVPVTAFYGGEGNIVNGNGNAVGNNSVNNAYTKEAIAEIAKAHELHAKSQEQIDRLLGIIEKLSN